MQYREHPVPESLRGHIACAWHLVDAAPAGHVQTIYPDGCCEIIVHLGTPPRAWDTERGWHDQADTLFAAQHLVPVRLQATLPMECIGLRLRPEASTVLGGQSSIRDRVLDLKNIDPTLGRALRRDARKFAAGDTASLWSTAEHWLAPKPVDALVAAAVGELRESAGAARIEAVARSLSVSLRSLQARFHKAVALTPKEFARIMRLRTTLHALDTGNASLADVAADRGFADQAHAARELRKTTGLAPARLRAALRKDREGDAAIRLAAAFLRGRS